MNKKFVPTEYDKQWMHDLIHLMAIGCVWGTTWAVYKKINEKTLAIVSSIDRSANTEENIERVKVVTEAIGLKFEDKR